MVVDVQVTFENIGKLFGSFEGVPLLETMDKLFIGLVKGVRSWPIINIPGSAYHHALQCRKKLEEIFYEELEKRKKRSKVETDDLMDGMMQIEDDEGHKLNDKEVVDNMVSLVVAGYSSTALVSMWAIYYLAKFPSVLAKLREENMAVKKDTARDFITSEEISKLKYTNKVLH